MGSGATVKQGDPPVAAQPLVGMGSELHSARVFSFCTSTAHLRPWLSW